MAGYPNIYYRKDQVDKRAFQTLVKETMDSYKTKAQAVRVNRKSDRFRNYGDVTLLKWIKEVWDRPTKPGRPKKQAS